MAQMSTPELMVDRDDRILTVTFISPERRNAMSWAMYDGLSDAIKQADRDDGIRVLVLRGAGDKAFISGTDISQFASFSTGADGVRYEERIAAALDGLEDLGIPTVALINGACTGAGLVIAAACDVRIATTSATFGVPIARTLGNCLSMNSYSLLASQLGPARVKDLLLSARLASAAELHNAGFINEMCAEDELADAGAAVVDNLLSNAPITMWATKKALTRLRRSQLPNGDDLVERAFGSEDFRTGVRAFLHKERAVWTGR
jgi:enoyl-CoA hydratase/carnithine racemase